MADNPEWMKDAAKAINKAEATGDQKMYEDVMGAADRHMDIENAQADMRK